MHNSQDHAARIMTLLRSIQANIKSKFSYNTEALGFTYSQVIVLIDIYRHAHTSLTELSKRLDLPKSSVSRIVDHLVNQGIVIRKIPPENRRMVSLFIANEFLQRREIQSMRAGFLNDIADIIEPTQALRIISALEELDTIIKSNILSPITRSDN